MLSGCARCRGRGRRGGGRDRVGAWQEASYGGDLIEQSVRHILLAHLARQRGRCVQLAGGLGVPGFRGGRAGLADRPLGVLLR
jgi:hypothetical protein